VISGKPSGVTVIPRVNIEAWFVDALIGDTALGEEDVEWSHIRSPDVHRIGHRSTACYLSTCGTNRYL
jgi:hypothetical protein